jgi:DNA-binding response OmpR family regulator
LAASDLSQVEDPAPRSAWQPATALVVDRDPVSRRFVELALTRGNEFIVESAESALGAMEIVHRQLIDLIISDTDLPDMNGLRLYRSLAQESRLRSIPFLFLSADQRPEVKVAAFKAGVADYVVKPCHPVELAARALSQVERERRTRQHAAERNYVLAGDLGAIGFPDLVNIIELERRSGTLSLVLAKAVGQIFFDGGRIVHAVYGNLVGPEAFYRFVGEIAGHFEFAPGACELADAARTIRDNATSLILEGARLLDVRNADRARRPTPAIASTAAPALPELEPALEPDASTAAQLVAGLADPFALGELCLWSAGDLARWTRRAVGTQRLHVHLIADMAAGVSAILGVAGGVTERWVLNGLEPNRKAFGVSFFLRRERTVDVVLLDAKQPDLFEPSLKRTPTIAIVAPPGGDAMSLGIRSRVAIENALRRFRPSVALAVGKASMQSDPGIAGMLAPARNLHVMPGVLGEAAADLRALLVEGIRRWATGKAGAR